MFVTLMSSAIAVGITFLYGCVGEILTEKSGHLNLGIPGIMSAGAAGGCVGVSLYMGALSSPDNANYFVLLLVAIITSAFFAAMLGAIYSFLTVTLRCNQNVTGLAITTFGVGLSTFLMEGKVDKTHFAAAGRILTRSLPFADNLGWFGEIFLSHGILVYLAIALALIAAFYLRKTKSGLYLCSIGENPATADAAGINVSGYKYGAVLAGSAIAGLGGLYYIMDYLRGSWEYGIEAMGWLAIALVIFTLWKPDLSILGAILFGALYIASSYITGVSFSEKKLLKLLPYVVTIVVLIITSVLDSKENQPPAALGLAYFREER